ncbi:MAG: DNA translocase FtsK, partial [Treponema sp.]|nr:DNA translocase FtsK [Treponema sp.]
MSPEKLLELLKSLKRPRPIRTFRAFLARPDLRHRLASLIAALALAVAGALLGVSIAAAILNIPELAPGPGDFLVRAYGILAFMVPLYLFMAAAILISPRFRPDRIFILTGTTFPFLTLAIGFAFLRDFNVRSREFKFLAETGRIGFSMIIILMTVIESFLIMALTSAFFPGPESLKTPKKKRKSRAAGPAPLLLPEPPVGPPAEPAPEPFFAPVPAAVFTDEPEEDETGAEDSGDEGGYDAEPAPLFLSTPEEERPYAQPAGKPPKAKRRGAYRVPVENILNQYPDGQYWVIDDESRRAGHILEDTLEEFKIQAKVMNIRKGPVITMFEILPAPGVKLSKIVGLGDNIALRLAASSIRIVAPIPGKHAVGIEVPNAKRNIVSLREIIEGELQREKAHDGKRTEIPVALGKNISGESHTIDLTQMPHLLIAGATGSGKSVCVNAMLLSILYQRSPAECRLILIDPKRVELNLYNDIPHLLTPVITDPKRAFQALQYCIYEMERRYACLDSMGVRDIRSYNRRSRERNMAAEHMPYIVVVIDEFADLMATTGKELENTVARLAAMSRAVGIHLVLATQRPSIDVITGLIKANIPSRIAFMVA